MKKDITSRDDIVLLVDEFFNRVQKDPLLAVVFNDVVKVNWEKHLPVMYDFFENMLFYTGSYVGNPMELHKHINRLSPLTEAHFNRWINLFTTTVDELFTGSLADMVKKRVLSISSIMQIKIAESTPAQDKIN